MKNNKGSIAIFVLIGLLFMTAFLLIAYSSNVNKAKSLTEQFNIVSKTYNPNSSNEISYTDAYTYLRRVKNFSQFISSENQEDTAVLELENTYLDDKLTNYKIYGAGQEIKIPITYEEEQVSSLPEQFQEVEYLESTGTQYIITNFVPQIGDSIDCRISISNITNTFAPFYSTSEADSGRQCAMLKPLNDTKLYFKCFTTGNASYISQNELQPLVGQFGNIGYQGDGTLYINNKTFSGEISKNKSETNAKLYVFARSNLQAYSQNLKIKQLVVNRQGNCVLNLIPCYRKSDNEIGLYDLVNNVFYTNVGTGDFIKGPNTNIVPTDYQEVEYLESTGTQYINTSFEPTINTRVEARVLVPRVQTASYPRVFGAQRNDNGTNAFLMGINKGTEWWARTGDSGNVGYSFAAELNKIYNVELQYNLFKINDWSTIGTQSWTKGTNGPMFIFAASQSGRFYADLSSSVRIYVLKIYEGNNFIRDFVPCYRKSDGEPGLYDMVKNTFYTNLGTGEFILGEEVFEGQEVGDLITNEFDEHYGEYKIELKVSNKENESYSEYIYLDSPLMKGDYLEYKERKVYRNDGTIEEIDLPEIKLYEDYTKIEIITNAKPPKIEADYKKYDMDGKKSNYQPLEYIESTGTQYINTNVTLQSEYSIEGKYNITSNINKSQCFWCARNGLYNDSLTVFWLASTGIRCDYNTNQKQSSYKPKLNEILNLEYKDKKFYINNTLLSTGTENFISGGKVSLFASYNPSQSVGTDNYGYYRLYNFSVWDKNHKLVLRLIPCYCKSDETVGMYDTVNDEFYTNSGTGEFIKGPNISWSQALY